MAQACTIGPEVDNAIAWMSSSIPQTDWFSDQFYAGTPMVYDPAILCASFPSVYQPCCPMLLQHDLLSIGFDAFDNCTYLGAYGNTAGIHTCEEVEALISTLSTSERTPDDESARKQGSSRFITARFSKQNDDDENIDKEQCRQCDLHIRTGGTGEFRTDSEICQANDCDDGYSRQLQAWHSDTETTLDGTLEDLCNDTDSQDSTISSWDQFEANRKLFGVVSTFKEDLSQYTIPLDVSTVPVQVKEKANRIAQEMETACWSRGDRKSPTRADDDEEDLWSAVPRASVSANKIPSGDVYSGNRADAPSSKPHARRIKTCSRWRTVS